jgi:DNA-binding LacI/PurR family transcriptional regulator
MAVTIEDVARAAGVSKSTVSLVINGKSVVKLETKYKVLQTIDKLGYIPNVAAQELTTKRKQTLGLVINTSKYNSFDSGTDLYFQDVIDGILSEIVHTSYSILYEQFPDARYSDEIPSIVRGKRIDGYFIIGKIFNAVLIERLLKEHISFVVINRNYPNLDCVYTDFKFATYLGVKYLIDAGHRKIAFVNSASTESSSGLLKVEGYKLALAEAGIGYNPKWVRESPYSGKGGFDATKDLWEAGVRPTAISTGSDSIAIGVMKYLHQTGVNIPTDVSVVGYEDSILAEYSLPALTTVRVNKNKIGAEAFKVLVERIKHPKMKPVHIAVTPDIVERDSVTRIGGNQ